MTARYLLDELLVDDGRVIAKANPEFHSRFLCQDLMVEYGSDIAIEHIDREILAVPFLLNTIPLVWLSGDTYYIRAIDKQLAQVLEEIRTTFRTIHPSFRWDGELVADRTITLPSCDESDKTGLLFTGGVDSMHASLAHWDIPQVFITLLSSRGLVNGERERVNAATRDYVRSCADEFGHQSSFVLTNLFSFISPSKLAGVWPRPRRWLIEIQHGLGFVGVTAPIVQQLDLAKLTMAGCELDHYGLPSGSHPDIINGIRWSGTVVSQEGADVKRQHKVHAVREQLEARHLEGIDLKPCLHPSDELENCCTCSKCLQTILGIIGDAGDPRDYGFDIEPHRAFGILRNQLERQRLPLVDLGELLQWVGIQSAIRSVAQDPAGSVLAEGSDAARAKWFTEVDLVRYFTRHQSSFRRFLRLARTRIALRLDPRSVTGNLVRRVLRPFLHWRLL
jgi:hypothetical protein